jgi:hypothetical protein
MISGDFGIRRGFRGRFGSQTVHPPQAGAGTRGTNNSGRRAISVEVPHKPETRTIERWIRRRGFAFVRLSNRGRLTVAELRLHRANVVLESASALHSPILIATIEIDPGRFAIETAYQARSACFSGARQAPRCVCVARWRLEVGWRGQATRPCH